MSCHEIPVLTLKGVSAGISADSTRTGGMMQMQHAVRLDSLKDRQNPLPQILGSGVQRYTSHNQIASSSFEQ